MVSMPIALSFGKEGFYAAVVESFPVETDYCESLSSASLLYIASPITPPIVFSNFSAL